MQDAYTHLDTSVPSPLADLRQRLSSANVAQALVVETWDGKNRDCLDEVLAYGSDRLRVALCIRPESGVFDERLLDNPCVAGIRVRGRDIASLGHLATKLASSGRWLIPHSDGGIRALTDALLELTAREKALNLYLPHLGWPRVDKEDEPYWEGAVSELSCVANRVVGISAIAHFSKEVFPHRDVAPFAEHLVRLFGAQSCVVGSDYPLFETSRYADYMNLAGIWGLPAGDTDPLGLHHGGGK